LGENRFENLNKDERGVYQMLDTLQTKEIQKLYNVVSILGICSSRQFDYGPIFSFGYNQVEYSLKRGGRTYFGPNDVGVCRVIPHMV
jgi:hypothetical protein